eukprot:TRINITY_DN12726_c0_g1_i1.p1 TRINITY_DN12726_c0_g1~~TRINITY_DN12726_c0_g1_i1.p1  ORF type:complete len:152 (+),score=19.27 TRINITY_DN12726_c0_g1_i1:681-1136(+)
MRAVRCSTSELLCFMITAQNQKFRRSKKMYKNNYIKTFLFCPLLKQNRPKPTKAINPTKMSATRNNKMQRKGGSRAHPQSAFEEQLFVKFTAMIRSPPKPMASRISCPIWVLEIETGYFVEPFSGHLLHEIQPIVAQVEHELRELRDFNAD